MSITGGTNKPMHIRIPMLTFEQHKRTATYTSSPFLGHHLLPKLRYIYDTLCLSVASSSSSGPCHCCSGLNIESYTNLYGSPIQLGKHALYIPAGLKLTEVDIQLDGSEPMLHCRRINGAVHRTG